MEAQEKVFRHSFGKVALSFFGVLLFGYVTFAFGEINYFLLLIAGYALIVSLLYATSSIRISSEGITSSRLLISKTMAWSEIGRVSMHGQGIQLHNRDEELTLSIDSQLAGYKEILDIIFTKRPDLVDREQNDVLSRSRLSAIWGIGISLFMIAIGVFLFFVLEGFERFYSLIFLILGVFLVVSWLLSPQNAILENNQLIVLYWSKEVCYSAGEISSISLEKVRTKNGYTYFVQLRLTSGKKIKFPTFDQSPLMYETLKRWHEKAVANKNLYSR